MRVLCLGDVVGENGCNALRNRLAILKKNNNIDLVVANGENSAKGNGITKESANHLFTSGVDVITGGNHSIRRKEAHEMLDEHPFLIRPANLPAGSPGKGTCLVDLGRVIVGVVNVMGVVYLEPWGNPFEIADSLIEEVKNQGARIVILDIHAEATAEKKALGYYLDGKANIIFGTHTHIQTNDAGIFENGTGYITDLGMCGPKNSVLGVKSEIVIAKLKDNAMIKFENEDGPSIINGCIFEIDDKSGKVISTEIVNFEC